MDFSRQIVYSSVKKTFEKVEKKINVVTQQKSDASDLNCQQNVTAMYFRPFWNGMNEVVKGSSRENSLVSTLDGCQADFHC